MASFAHYKEINILYRYKVDFNRDHESIDKWIETHIQAQPKRNLQASDIKSQLSEQHLQITQALLEASGFPIFTPGRLIAIAEQFSDDAWQAKLACPWMDGLHVNSLLAALQAGFELLRLVGTLEKTYKEDSEINQWIEQSIATLSKNAPPGKSTVNILKCAYAEGIPFFYLAQGTFQVGSGSKSQFIDRSLAEGDSIISIALAQSKGITNSLLKKLGIPVPNQRVIQSEEEAISAAKTLNWPVVVKPNHLDRGEGVTININSQEQLISAFLKAKSMSKKNGVIIEEMQAGTCHRIVIVNGQLVYALKRLPIAVHGDGVRSISELISEFNHHLAMLPPWKRQGKSFLPHDELTTLALQKQGLQLSSVPEKNQLINLKEIESTEWGGRDEDMTATIHPDNVRLAIAATEAVRLQVAGVDIMSLDLTRPWYTNKATINEINSAPLIGGGATSKNYLKRFLTALLGEDPTIPVQILNRTETTLKEAKDLQAEMLKKGIRCFVAAENVCIDNAGNRMPTLPMRIDKAIQCLMRNKNVDHILALR